MGLLLSQINNIEKISLKNFRLIRFILCFVFILSFIVFLRTLTHDYYPDFVVYYNGTKSLLDGFNPYQYSGNVVNFVYPPSVLLFFVPLVFLPLYYAQIFLILISLFSLFLSIFIFFRIFKVSFFSATGIFIYILLLNFFPAKYTLGMGQINNIVLLCVTLFIYFYIKKRDYLSATFLALAIAIKLFPVLIILYLIIKKKWKILKFLITILLLISFLIGLFIDTNINMYFIQNVVPNLFASTKIDYYNQALSGFLLRGFDETFNISLVKSFVTLLLILFTSFFIWKNRNNEKSSTLSMGTLITLTLMVNAYSWQHHFVFMIIPLLITFFYIKNNNLNIKYYLLLGLSYLLVAINLRSPYDYPIILQSHVFYGASILYILESYFMYRSTRIKK